MLINNAALLPPAKTMGIQCKQPMCCTHHLTQWSVFSVFGWLRKAKWINEQKIKVVSPTSSGNIVCIWVLTVICALNCHIHLILISFVHLFNYYAFFRCCWNVSIRWNLWKLAGAVRKRVIKRICKQFESLKLRLMVNENYNKPLVSTSMILNWIESLTTTKLGKISISALGVNFFFISFHSIQINRLFLYWV